MVKSAGTEGEVRPLTELPHHDRRSSAQKFDEWINVLFNASSRILQGAAPIVVLAFSVIELVNPKLLGEQSISRELAQTLLGASLGALGIDFIGRRRTRG